MSDPILYLVLVSGDAWVQGTSKREILLALTAEESPPLGNIWRITAKKSDFYLDTIGVAGESMHVSLHGPRGDFERHRFHLRIDRKAARDAKASGHFVQHKVPSRGQQFRGRPVAEHAFHVVRLRWRWHLQRDRYREAAVFGNAPDIGEGQTGRRLGVRLHPNSAWDVDVYVSHGRPFWPIQLSTSQGDPRMGPVRNDSNMWLTALSVHRAEKLDPSPDQLVPRLPRLDETPNRLTCGGLGPTGEEDFYWFVETITAKELLTS